MNQDQEERAKIIANFRFGLIAPIVSRRELNPGETQLLLEDAAKKHYQIPYSTKTQVSCRTIERYLSLFRDGGYDALYPKYLIAKQGSSKIPIEYLELAAKLKRENMKRAIPQIIQTLELGNQVPKGVLKRSTVYDYFVRKGISREQIRKESKAYQRFTPKHRNQRWQGDTCHLLHLPMIDNPEKSLKVYLIAWLDEYSRIVSHAQLYYEEKGYCLEDCLKKAIMKYGIPEQVYVDNGKIYSSNQIAAVCGRLSMMLSHTRPYRPQGRGKLERFFLSVQTSFLPEIEVILRDRLLSLDELNEYLSIWIRHHYHDKIHSATKQRPMVAFEADPEPLRYVDLQELEEAFLVETTRKVDKTCCIKLHGKEFCLSSPELVGVKVVVRYNPHDMVQVQIYYEGKRYADAMLLDVPEHIDFDRPQNKEPEVTERTGLNYLDILKEQNVEGLSFARSEKA